MTQSSREERAAEYRRLAIEESTLAEESGLPRVREKHEFAATKWRALAAGSEYAPKERESG